MKNKHDGIFPIGSNAKRKIPRHTDDDSDNLFVKDPQGFYNDFKDYVSQIEDASSKEMTPMTKSKIEQLLSEFFKPYSEKSQQII